MNWFPRKTLRQWPYLAAAVVGLSACTLIACGGSEPVAKAAPDGSPQAGGVLRLSLPYLQNLDPAFTEDVYQATITQQIFSGLLRWDAELNIQPDLALSWHVDRSGLVYTFTLRKNARFHDGAPVTAQDVVYTFTRLFDASAVPSGIIQDYLDAVEGVDAYRSGEAPGISGFKAIGSRTLVIRLTEPYSSFLHVLCMDQARIVPRHILEGPNRTTFARQPVGSGPFRLVEQEPALVLAANRDYFGRQALLDSVQVIPFPAWDPQAEIEAFAAGRLDMADLSEREATELEAVVPCTVLRRMELSLKMVMLNVRRDPFQDVRVRRALAMAIDRRALAAFTAGTVRTPAGVVPPGMSGFHPDSKLVAYDPEGARALLREAGYDRQQPLTFSYVTHSPSPEAQALDQILLDSWEAIGARVQLKNMDWGSVNLAMDEGTADAFQMNWLADLPDMDSFLYTLLAGDGGGNVAGYANAKVDSLLNAGRRLEDSPTRHRLYRTAERLALSEAPLIPISYHMTSYVLQPHVRGVEISPFGGCSIPFNKVWLAPSAEGALHVAR